MVLGGLSAIVLGVIAPSSAQAGSPIECPPGSVWNPALATCVIVVTDPGDPGGGGTGGGGTGGGGSSGPAECRFVDRVPCTSADGWGYWSNELACYVGPTKATYPPDSPIWEGHYPDGAIYSCYNPFSNGTRNYDFWSARQPAGPAAPPDPRVLAEEAVAAMELRAITMGLVPEPGRDRVGLVGVPNWMWVAEPTQNTYGPITRTATAGAFSVTATAKVSQVTWDMGDGQIVSCGAGTPYSDSYGKSTSPTCGHTYAQQGSYTVRATSHWVITWAGIGQTGTIPVDLTQTAQVTIGEAQVLKQ